MAVLLTDEEIAALLSEVKHLPGDYRSKLDLKPKRGHRESELVLPRQAGGAFHVIIRQAGRNLLDFSVILGFTPQGSNRLIRLRRYNGKSHEHTNKIEGARFSRLPRAHGHAAIPRSRVSRGCVRRANRPIRRLARGP